LILGGLQNTDKVGHAGPILFAGLDLIFKI